MSSATMLRFCFLISVLYLFILTNGGKVQTTKKESGKLIWSIKTPCHQCIYIALCPVICKHLPTSKPLLKPTNKPFPTPVTTVIPPTPPPPTPPIQPAPTTPTPPIQPPPPTPAPPIQPAPTTPAPPIQPPSPTPALPIQPPPSIPAPPIQPAPETPAPPIQPPPTPSPPVQPLPPNPAPPIQPLPQTPVPPIQPPPPTLAPPTGPGEITCPVPVTKKGCFKDDQSPPRPLPNYILTDRDSSLTIYSGKGVDWENWINYLPDFVCRCAQLAISKNFKFFGIQYYGECWSGPSQDESSYQEDGSSTECVNTKWKRCSDQSKLACAGKEKSNYVYAIVP